MVISGSLLIGCSEQCFHISPHRSPSFSLGIMFHERFDLGNGWITVNLGKWGFQITLSRIKDVRRLEV